MSIPITAPYTDRKFERDFVDTTLSTLERGKTPFIALEFYGIAGLGKSRILDAVKAKCRARQTPFVALDFITYPQYEVARLPLDILLRICDQLEPHYPNISEARTEARMTLERFTRKEFTHFEEITRSANLNLEPYTQLILKLITALSPHPLIMLLDNTENCPRSAFNWLGALAEFLTTHGLTCVVFSAGRRQSIKKGDWPSKLKNLTNSLQLDPFDFDATEEHITPLIANTLSSQAIQTVYALSNGHPYSNEAIIRWLQQPDAQLDLSLTATSHKHLAERLKEEVIKEYILAGTHAEENPWILPFLEVASIARRFEMATLQRITTTYRPECETELSTIGAHMRVLQNAPYNFVSNGANDYIYTLEPTLRKLLHTTLVALDPKVTEAHQSALSAWKESLKLYRRDSEQAVTAMLELLYHMVQIAVLEGHDRQAAVNTWFEFYIANEFLAHRSNNQLNLADLHNGLKEDKDLRRLIGNAELDTLLGKISQMTPVSISTRPGNILHFTITRASPENEVLWGKADQSTTVKGYGYANSEGFKEIESWRDKLDEIGKVAFGRLLPYPAQEFVKSHSGYALQITTDRPDIPWELMHDGQEFLCLSHPMTRKPVTQDSPRESVREQREHLRALIIGDTLDDLPGARAEALAIAQLLSARGLTVDALIGREQATTSRLWHKISGGYDIIHYAGHCTFDHKRSDRNGLKLADGIVKAEEFQRQLTGRPFVFLSACDAGKSSMPESKFDSQSQAIHGLAISFLLGGASALLAPLWEVGDSITRDFAIAFYEQLCAEDNLFPIDEIVRRTRLKIRERSFEFWAAWVLYGDPFDFIKL